MRIVSLKLENIRSYTDQFVEFPNGSTLLIGDIGSGKSSILLAIEFALFGARRTDLSANSLLRNGKNRGSVELHLEINKKSVVVKRNLRRAKSSVVQDSGFILIDGKKSEGTTIELKSKVLQLIGYPEEFLTKSKSLIYRYTVFTPQEEMKKILFESVDDRINALRKIFNIDRYKRIKENLLVFLRELRSSRKVLESKVEDLDELLVRKNDFDKRRNVLEHELKENKPLLVEVKKELDEKLELLERLEKELLENQKVRQKIAVNNQNIANRKESIEKNREKIQELEKQVVFLKEKSLKKLPEINLEDYKKKIESSLSNLQARRDNLFKEMSIMQAKIDSSTRTIDSVSSIDKCPTCLQIVDNEHKNLICEEQKKIIQDSEKSIREKKSLLDETSQKLEKIKTGEKKISRIELLKKEKELHQKSVEEKAKQITGLKNENTRLQESVIELKSQQQNLEKQLKKEDSEKIQNFKSLIDSLRKNAREKELLINSVSKELEMISFQEKEIRKLIDQKLEQKKSLQKISKYQDWMENFLVNVLDVIEKNVFVSIHRSFDETFQTWFKEIIDEEAIDVRLDETFTPIIEQNGYETFLDHLSGGEKTSVALAYRLALNKVINDFITGIKTDELIILDEPTDGFSSEQLDRMRDVLEKLNMKQTIIVSHEPKMESYVENVVRVVKRDHVSRVFA